MGTTIAALPGLKTPGKGLNFTEWVKIYPNKNLWMCVWVRSWGSQPPQQRAGVGASVASRVGDLGLSNASSSGGRTSCWGDTALSWVTDLHLFLKTFFFVFSLSSSSALRQNAAATKDELRLVLLSMRWHQNNSPEKSWGRIRRWPNCRGGGKPASTEQPGWAQPS